MNTSNRNTYAVRSASMESAALILSIIALVASACLYISIPCGALAIILAFLSRGGAKTLSRKALLAVGLGIFAITACTILYSVSYYSMIRQYGSMENAMKAYSELYGIDYSKMLGL